MIFRVIEHREQNSYVLIKLAEGGGYNYKAIWFSKEWHKDVIKIFNSGEPWTWCEIRNNFEEMVQNGTIFTGTLEEFKQKFIEHFI